jgi:hypothetical protein
MNSILKTSYICILILILIPCTFSAFGQDKNVFNLDEAKIQNTFKAVNDLESFLLENEDYSLSDIKSIETYQDIELSYDDSLSSPKVNDSPWGIPSFAWGFCLSIPGVVIVYSVTADEAELKKAMIGCVLGTGILGGCFSLTQGLSSLW